MCATVSVVVFLGMICLASTAQTDQHAITTPAALDSVTVCGEATNRGDLTLIIECTDPGATITGFDFASFGTPTGDCTSGFEVNSSCNYASSLSWATSSCVNKSVCILSTTGLPDPCEGVIKSLAVEALCSSGSGSALPMVPPCSMTQGTPPCPLPAWEPVWQLNKSTICQPANVESFLNATEAARWGLVSLDWTIASSVWLGNGNVSNMTGAATLVEQCRQIKVVDPDTKCFVYRNTELALEWMEPQRAVMDDPAFASWFLQYQPGNPENITAGTPYNEDAGGPASGCRQFFWNYSNEDAFQYVLSVSEQGMWGTSSEWVDGTFLDDSQAVPQEHPNAPSNMGMTTLQLLRAQNDTYHFFNTAVGELASTGHFIWQGFNGNQQGDPDEVGVAPNAGNCASFMRAMCVPGWQDVPMTMQWPSSQADKLPVLAAFLISRGPYAYIGTGFNDEPIPPWDPLWDSFDVGEPTSLCAEVPTGVFSRQWSNGNVSLDCTSWTATFIF